MPSKRQQKHLLREQTKVDAGVALAQSKRHNPRQQLARETTLLSYYQRRYVGLYDFAGGSKRNRIRLAVCMGQNPTGCCKIHFP